MKFVLFIAFFATIALSHDHSHGGDDHDHDHELFDDILTLTSANFNDELNAHDVMMVEFFAPWCGHCKSLQPEYEAAAHEMYNEVPLGQVDCTEERELCHEYGVQGFPTLKVFRNDGSDPIDYQGPRTTDAIVEYMRKQNAPAYLVLTSSEDIVSFTNTPGSLVLGLFASLEDAGAVEFFKVAQALRNDFHFAITVNPAHGRVFKEPLDNPSVTIFRTFDEPQLAYTGSFTQEGITAFLQLNALPLVGEIGPDTYAYYVDRGIPIMWSFLDPEDEDTKAILSAVAPSAKGSLSVVYLDGIKWEQHAKSMGSDGSVPTIIIDATAIDGFKYLMTEDVSEESVAAFVAEYLAGTLAPYVKSEPVPESQDEAVLTVVGKTFKQIVLDDTKDVFLEFYAPWCGHCKSLAPKFDALAEEFANVDSVIIAKIDGTANDHPASEVKGFPTLILYPAGADPITYSGDRSAAAMAEFIRKNARSDLSESKTAQHDEL